MVDRPVDVVQFSPDGTRVERLASFPQIPDLTTMTVLPDGHAVLPVRASSRVRLMAVQKGKEPAPLVNTMEETAAPVAACGSRELALMIGPEPHETIAFAEPASGRLVRTITPHKGPVDSMSCSPDGTNRLFLGARRRLERSRFGAVRRRRGTKSPSGRQCGGGPVGPPADRPASGRLPTAPVQRGARWRP